MKYLYIAGLEHSGTTLLSHLFGQHENFLALGEIAALFSSSHMDQYFKQWGEYDDATLCSCQRDWRQCDFWGNLEHLYGHNSNDSLVQKYRALFDYCSDRYSSSTVIVDSSKSLATLQKLISNSSLLGIDKNNVSVLLAVKDVRNFATSISHKTKRNSLLHNYRSFNWWLGENQKMMNYLLKADLKYDISLYDEFCISPNASLNRHFQRLAYQQVEKVNVNHSESHIAMGNKNFLVRNRTNIKCDDRWKANLNVKLTYALHSKARALNKSFYAN